MERLSKEQWQDSYVSSIRQATKKNSKNTMLLELFDKQGKTPFEERLLKTMFDSEYKSYLAKLDFESIKKSADEKYLTALESLKKERQREAAKSRKSRAHELIKIGALTDVADFEKDRGLILGALLHVKEIINNNAEFKKQLKDSGDALLHEIEKRKNQV